MPETRDDQLRALVAEMREKERRFCRLADEATELSGARLSINAAKLAASAEGSAYWADRIDALLASPPAPHDALLDAARAVDAAVRRTHNHTEWLEPLSRLMHAVEGTAASPPAPAQEWQPIETAPGGAVILRPHRIWGAMDVRRIDEADAERVSVLAAGIPWAWLNGDYTTAWTESAFLPFWMPVPPNPPRGKD